MTEISEETLDAVTTTLLQKLAEIGLYEELMGTLPDDQRVNVEAAIERHAARRRAAGAAGW